jgi:hypothetical protein
MSGKYGINGVIILVAPSPTRYAAVLISGLIPININIGTNTGARSAHLALAEPIKRLIVAPNKIIIVSNIESGKLEPSNTAAPLIANINPRFDQLNIATK